MDNVIRVLKEFEGIFGTILGILIGAIISYFQSNFGRVTVFLIESEYYFLETIFSKNKNKDTEVDFEKTGNGVNSFEFKFISNIEIYNSSNTRKFLRNIRLCVKTNKGLEYQKIYTESNKVFEVLNIEPKTITSYTIYTDVSHSKKKEGLFLNELDTVYIEYENIKGKINKLEVKNSFKT